MKERRALFYDQLRFVPLTVRLQEARALTEAALVTMEESAYSKSPTLNCTLWDYPASYHNRAGILSFTDGHCENHGRPEKVTIPLGKKGGTAQAQHLLYRFKPRCN